MAESSDDALHRVFAEMPPGWHFKGVYLADKRRGDRVPGTWYASASGPDPRDVSKGMGMTGLGPTMASALSKLASHLIRVSEEFEA